MDEPFYSIAQARSDLGSIGRTKLYELVARGDLELLKLDSVAARLRALEYMPAPRKLENPEHWRAIVRDAMAIAREGWAAKAIALGWTAGDLFGIGPRGDWDFSGLAVWLRGRAIVLLDQDRAIVAAGDQRSTFVRGGMGHGTHPTIAPVMLWEFGR